MMKIKTDKKSSTRGRTFIGQVVSDKATKTVTVSWSHRKYIPKYERHETKITKIKAHNPESINASNIIYKNRNSNQ